MKNKKSVFIVQIIAIITAAIALFSLPGLVRVIWMELGYSPRSDAMSEMYVLNFLWIMWFVLLLILKIVTAYGLFRIRAWAWKLAMIVFSAEFLSRLYGILSIPGEPPTLNHSEGGIIESFSSWLIYIHAVIPLIFIIVLFQKPIKKRFSKTDTI
ncbi:MAG: hypothetical protein ACK5L8_08090 [Marinicella pacifica]